MFHKQTLSRNRSKRPHSFCFYSALCCFALILVILLAIAVVLIFIYSVGPTKLVNLAVDRKILKLRRWLDPLKIAASFYEFNYTFYFKFKLGSISWSSTNVSGLANLQRVGDVILAKRSSFFEANISVACVDLKASSVMNPRLGSFRSTVDVPVMVTLSYVKVNFSLTQNISFSDPPTVNHLAVVRYDDLDVKFKLNSLANGLMKILTTEILKYYKVRFKEMMEKSLQQKMNEKLANYTLPEMFNPFYWLQSDESN